MGLTDRVGGINVIKDLCTQAADIRCVAHMSWLLGLSAAVYTAARTSHDFDEVVVSFAGFHFFKQFLCIAKAGSNGNLYIHAGYIVGGFLDSLCAAHFLKIQLRQFLAGQCLNGCPQSRLHNASGCAEDNGRTRAKTQGIVKLLIGKV